MRAILFLILLASIASYAQDIRKIEVEALISGIAKDNGYDTEGIGIGGHKSMQRYRYEELRDKATREELYEATQHTNAVVVCYAFEALVEKKDINVCVVLENHFDDTTELCTQMGCSLGSTTVEHFFLALAYQHIEKFNYIKHRLDSLVLHRLELEPKGVPLELHYQSGYEYKKIALLNIEPKPEYYNRLKSLYLQKSSVYPSLIIPIAKYKHPKDTLLVGESIEKSSTFNFYGIDASRYYPTPYYYPTLAKKLNIYLSEKYITIEVLAVLEVLIKSLANYETDETKNIFIHVLSQNDFHYKMFLYDAISDKPYFKEILDQIEFK